MADDKGEGELKERLHGYLQNSNNIAGALILIWDDEGSVKWNVDSLMAYVPPQGWLSDVVRAVLEELDGA